MARAHEVGPRQISPHSQIDVLRGNQFVTGVADLCLRAFSLDGERFLDEPPAGAPFGDEEPAVHALPLPDEVRALPVFPRRLYSRLSGLSRLCSPRPCSRSSELSQPCSPRPCSRLNGLSRPSRRPCSRSSGLSQPCSPRPCSRSNG